MGSILQEIVSLLTGGLTQIATGLGSGLTSLVTNLFMTGTGTTSDPYKLSVFGGVAIIFAGVSLAVGLSRWVTSWITSLGN